MLMLKSLDGREGELSILTVWRKKLFDSLVERDGRLRCLFPGGRRLERDFEAWEASPAMLTGLQVSEGREAPMTSLDAFTMYSRSRCSAAFIPHSAV